MQSSENEEFISVCLHIVPVPTPTISMTLKLPNLSTPPTIPVWALASSRLVGMGAFSAILWSGMAVP